MKRSVKTSLSFVLDDLGPKNTVVIEAFQEDGKLTNVFLLKDRDERVQLPITETHFRTMLDGLKSVADTLWPREHVAVRQGEGSW